MGSDARIDQLKGRYNIVNVQNCELIDNFRLSYKSLNHDLSSG